MEKICRLWLHTIVQAQRSHIANLIDTFDSAEAIYNLSESEIDRIDFISDSEKSLIKEKNIQLAREYLDSITEDGTVFITPDDNEYPVGLFDLKDYPQGLFCRGKMLDMNSNILIGMVGARKCSSYGYDCAKTLARKVASEGAIIVSGMALGIDSAAHEGALSSNAPTIAVLGCGVNLAYPPSNHGLMKRIIETGLVISEYPVNTKTSKFTFPERNRIIAGMSKGVAVIEANLKSGSLITARLANKYGRDLFAVPGNINSDSSTGTNSLIKSGAVMVTSAADITEPYKERLTELSSARSKSASCNAYSAGSSDNNGNTILKFVTAEPKTVDTLSAEAGLAPQQVSTALLMLELTGDVISCPGGKYCLSVK